MKRKVEDLTRRRIYAIAVSYANSKDTFSASYYCGAYGISQHVFYRCLEKAVEESIVSEYIAKRISEKAARNAYEHAGEGAKINSLNHYQELIAKRESFKFKPKEQKKFVEQYADCDLSLPVFCANEYIRINQMNEAISDVIVGNLISDEYVEKLLQKSKKICGEEVTEKCFDALKAMRKEKIEAKKEHQRQLRKARQDSKK